jgi:hypothetical protein
MVMMARLVVQRRRDVIVSMMTTMAHDDADGVT